MNCALDKVGKMARLPRFDLEDRTVIVIGAAVASGAR